MSRRVTVVHVVAGLPVGGLEHNLLMIARCHNRQQFRMLVVCLYRPGAMASEIRAEGVQVIELFSGRKISRLAELLRVRQREKGHGFFLLTVQRVLNTLDKLLLIKPLVALMKREKVDILNTHLEDTGFTPRIAARIANVSVVVVTLQNEYPERRRVRILLDQLLSRYTERIITVSESLKRVTARQMGIPEDKFITIHNSLDRSWFQNHGNLDSIAEKKREMGIDPTEWVIGTIGSLKEQKGHIYLLQAAVQVLQEVPNTKFILVGNGRKKTELEAFAKANGIDRNIVFVGETREVAGLLQVMDIFVFPSLWEGFGVALLEAMGMGKPVVGSNVSSIPEIIGDEGAGVLVPARDPSSLAQAILRLLRDGAERERIRTQAYLRAKSVFSTEAMIPKLENLYLTLLGQKVHVSQ